MTESIQNEHARTLYTLARAEESTLSLPLPDHVFGFLAQQSYEKYMKALLSARDNDFPRNHDLVALQRLLAAGGETLPETPMDLADLQPYAVQLRYEMNDAGDLSRSSILSSIQIVGRHVLSRILAIEAATPPE